MAGTFAPTSCGCYQGVTIARPERPLPQAFGPVGPSGTAKYGAIGS